MVLVPEKRELFGQMSVEDNLLLGSYTRRGASAAMTTAAFDNVYARFPRLRERRTQFAASLSGGERQMLAIGRALMSSPKLIMFDEPSLGLAPIIVGEMFEIITSLKETGVSVLLIEQNAQAALSISDYGYVFERGEIVCEGTSETVARDPRVADVYLGVSPSINH
jgi:branched-chain amino acid transport system ATP-binding protein